MSATSSIGTILVVCPQAPLSRDQDVYLLVVGERVIDMCRSVDDGSHRSYNSKNSNQKCRAQLGLGFGKAFSSQSINSFLDFPQIASPLPSQTLDLIRYLGCRRVGDRIIHLELSSLSIGSFAAVVTNAIGPLPHCC